MEYNIMRELNVNEIQEVTGGVAPLAVMAAKYTIAKIKITYGLYKLAKAAG